MTNIEWTDETWNPVTGCTKISAGCENCYAERMSKRLGGRCGYNFENPFDITLRPDRLEQPFRWKKSRRIFVCSMGDLFHRNVPAKYIAAVFGVMAANPQHTFQVLTKRPDRMVKWFKWVEMLRLYDGERCSNPSVECAFYLLNEEKMTHPEGDSGPIHCQWGPAPDATWPLKNVWIGVTAENQQTANGRIPVLLEIPAAVRFVSCEPLLGPINLKSIAHPSGNFYQVLEPIINSNDSARPALDWVITGSETGLGARHMDPSWAINLRQQCADAGVPFFFKKMSKGQETQAKLMVREFPK